MWVRDSVSERGMEMGMGWCAYVAEVDEHVQDADCSDGDYDASGECLSWLVDFAEDLMAG